MKKRKVISLLIGIMIMLALFCKATYAAEESKSDLSKRYQEWLELPQEKREKIIAPTPYNIRGKSIDTRFEKANTRLKTIVLPSKYDLRDHINVVVKNQMSTGLCWGFSANTSLETTLEKQGETFNFSERHLEYDTVLNFSDGQNENGLNRSPGDGGTSTTAFTYYSRGSGPILEEDMPFVNNERVISLAELPTNVAVKKVDNMIFFPNVYKRKDSLGNITYIDANYNTYTEAEVLNIRNSIKEHIMTYGAVSISIAHDGDGMYHTMIASNKTLNADPDHAVTIIGWDDNFSKNNFPASCRPKNNGAYIVLNSWGTDWGLNGVYYISYEDAYVESEVRGEYGISDIEYDNLYQHDTSELYGYLICPYGANVFEAKNNEMLTEVMVGLPAEQTCNIYVNPSSDSLNLSNFIKVASNKKLKAGYNTVELNNDILLTKGTKFVVAIEIVDSNYVGISAEYNIQGSTSNAISHRGESYASMNGTSWSDIYNPRDMMNISIKAYTKEIEKTIEVSDPKGSAVEKVGGKFSFGVKTSYTEEGKPIEINVYKGTRNVTDQFTIRGNTIRVNGAFVTLECKSTIEEGDYDVKIKVNNYDPVFKTIHVEKNENILKYKVTFLDYNGSILKEEIVEEGKNATPPTNPTRERTAEYTYTFNGWSGNYTNVQKDEMVIATYLATKNKYTVIWKNYNGDVLETDENVEYGTVPEYNGAVPTRENDETYTYSFSRWDPEVKAVEGDTQYVAIYERHRIEGKTSFSDIFTLNKERLNKVKPKRPTVRGGNTNQTKEMNAQTILKQMQLGR